MKRSILSAILASMVLLPCSEPMAQEANTDDKALIELREAMKRLSAGSSVTNSADVPAVAAPKADSREEALERLREALANLDQPTAQVASNSAPSDVPVIDPETIRRLQDSMKASTSVVEAPEVREIDRVAPPTAAVVPETSKIADTGAQSAQPVVIPDASLTDQEIDQQFRRNAANESGRRGSGLSAATLQFNETHRLRSGDKLSYLVLEDPDADDYGVQPVIVRATNVATFPVSMNPDYKADFIEVATADRTIASVEAELKRKLEEHYYEKATIRLQLDEGSSTLGRVIFTGYAQGVVTLNPGQDKTLVEAISSLGGFQREWADMRRIILTRQDPKTGETTKKEYDFNVISKDQRLDPVLRDGDYVEIREKTFNFFGN